MNTIKNVASIIIICSVFLIVEIPHLRDSVLECQIVCPEGSVMHLNYLNTLMMSPWCIFYTSLLCSNNDEKIGYDTAKRK